MDQGCTAQLPDGSRSRLGWLIWVGVGFFLGLWAFQATLSMAFLSDVVLFPTTAAAGPTVASLTEFVLSTLGVLVVAALIALGASFARRRLLMPEAVWLSASVVPVLGIVVTIPSALQGENSPLLFVMTASSILIAWVWLRWRDSMRPVGTSSDLGSSV